MIISHLNDLDIILEQVVPTFPEGLLVFSEHMDYIITNGMQDSRPCIKECWGQGYFMGPLSAAPLNVGQSNDLVALTSPNVTASVRSQNQTGNGVDSFPFAKYFLT